MIHYKAKECTCWLPYPNYHFKKANGQWKCVDCYKQVRERKGYAKTKCVLIEEGNKDETDNRHTQ